MTYDELLIEADDTGVIVKEAPLCSGDGRCKGKRIAIRRDIPTLAKKADVLAEELGHYHTTVGDIVEIHNTADEKQERAARMWGYNKQIGLCGIIDAYKHHCQNRFEVAEYLGVSEDTLEDAIECYRQIYGLKTVVDNYIIQFEPTLQVYMIKMFY